MTTSQVFFKCLKNKWNAGYKSFQKTPHNLQDSKILNALRDSAFSVYDSLTGEVVRRLQGHKSCVRDVSWHPYQPEILSSSVSTEYPKAKLGQLPMTKIKFCFSSVELQLGELIYDLL